MAFILLTCIIHKPLQTTPSYSEPVMIRRIFAIGKYYQYPADFPRALINYIQFDYPIDKAGVSATCLHLPERVQSSGGQYPVWFSSLPGYRDESKIY